MGTSKTTATVFLEEPNSLSKKITKIIKISHLPPASGSPKIIENTIEVEFFNLEEKCAFL